MQWHSAVVIVMTLGAHAFAQPSSADPSVPARAPALIDDESVRSTKTAQRLARDGHCDLALHYANAVEQRSPDYYRSAFVADPYIASCMAGHALSAAASPPDDLVTAETRAACRSGLLYAEPSLMFAVAAEEPRTGGPSGPLLRASAGLQLRDCIRVYGVGGRIGATFVYDGNKATGGGLEGEVQRVLPHGRMAGARIGFEALNYKLVSAGVRYHAGDVVIGLDLYYATHRGAGMMLAFGFGGNVGAGVTAIGVLLGLLAVSAAGGT